MRDESPTSVPETDGSDTFVKQFDPGGKNGGLFRYAMPSFVNGCHTAVCRHEGETPVRVLDTPHEFDFAKILESGGVSSVEDCFTEHQVNELVRKHREWFSAIAPTNYFPFLIGDSVHIAAIFAIEDGSAFGLDVYRFDYSREWRGSGQKLIVKQSR